ncbi:MAG TPA: thiamine phosphate synthase [Thermoleophilaceae bacterium]|jgi:thiamine-phosphate pyrophosphorylase
MARRDHAERIRHASLYLILEVAAAHAVEPALEGGVDVVQIRDKHAPDGELVAAGHELGDLCRRHGALFVVNDRPDLALECGADGVHVGQDDESVDAVRALAGDRLFVGVSTHSPAQVAAAEESDADYFAVGPVHATPTKPGRPAVGLELVRHAAEHARKPWFAIGGIDAGNAAAVVAAGARRLAVVRAIRDADDPRAAARELRAIASGATGATGAAAAARGGVRG